MLANTFDSRQQFHIPCPPFPLQLQHTVATLVIIGPVFYKRMKIIQSKRYIAHCTTMDEDQLQYITLVTRMILKVKFQSKEEPDLELIFFLTQGHFVQSLFELDPVVMVRR